MRYGKRHGGLVPAIHVFVSVRLLSRGCPQQVRA
jgi:hypothetical protein